MSSEDDATALPMRKSDPITFNEALISGSLSGALTDSLFYPLDTLKVRLQSKEGLWASGGFRGVWRGVGSVLVGSGPGAAAFFTTYEYLKGALPREVGVFRDGPGWMNHLGSSVGAEIVSIYFRLPFEILKSRTQTDAYGQGTTLIKSARMIWRYEGLRGYWRGYGGTLGRDIPFVVTQFPLYEHLRAMFARKYPSSTARKGEPSAWQSSLAGSLSGMAASIVTQPVDVVRTRIMLEAKKQGQDPLKTFQSTSLFPRILLLIREEGFPALFKGVIPRTTAVAVAGAVYLGMYEGIKGNVRGKVG